MTTLLRMNRVIPDPFVGALRGVGVGDFAVPAGSRALLI